MRDDLLLIRDGKGTARAHRVATTPRFVQAGVRSNVWYTGSVNVDVRDEEEIPAIVNVVDDSISLTLNYAYLQIWTPLDYYSGTYLNTTRRNFMRLFSVRAEMVKLFGQPLSYELLMDNQILPLYVNGDSQKVWQLFYGDDLSMSYVAMLTSYVDTSGKRQMTSFSIETRASGLSPLRSYKIPFAIRRTGTTDYLAQAVITFTAGMGYIEAVYGFQAMKTWNMETYTGKSAEVYAGTVLTLQRLSQRAFNNYVAALSQ